eukprot:sb/3473968/
MIASLLQVIETELESVVVILGEDNRFSIQVLTELSQAEVCCREFQEQWQQEEVYVKTLKQQKKSLELRIVEIETLHQAELRRWTEEKKTMERRIEDFEWKLDEMRKRDDLMSGERREWKVEKEDLLEESAHLTGQVNNQSELII